MNKYNFAFDVPCGDELECHELLPGEFISNPVEDEEDLEWLDKGLYLSPNRRARHARPRRAGTQGYLRDDKEEHHRAC
jgi:hypothetical protein